MTSRLDAATSLVARHDHRAAGAMQAHGQLLIDAGLVTDAIAAGAACHAFAWLDAIERLKPRAS